jgi:hypothetical protein
VNLFSKVICILLNQNQNFSKTNTIKTIKKTNTNINITKPFQNQYRKTESFGFGACLGKKMILDPGILRDGPPQGHPTSPGKNFFSPIFLS